jgi:Zn-dependent protease with chaperone function/type II secretory pathway pseudopilin PulG
MDLVYRHEGPLFAISLVLSLLIWLVLIVGTVGVALVYLLVFFVIYLFAQSALISYLQGSAVRISPQQFPDLHQRLQDCCTRLRMSKVPEAFVMHADGAFNAFATRFLGRNFVALFSDVVDALEPHPDAINFYIGHELGHIHRGHLAWAPVLWPASVLPLLGAGYSRAREYTCDLYGYACCNHPGDATRALAALAAGGRRWQTLDLPRYAGQSQATGGFWMSFHELVGGYPWLVKRMERLMARAEGRAPDAPRRNPFAWLLALFVPNLGFGAGAGASLLVLVVVFGVLAAVAIPAFQDFTARAQVSQGLGQVAEIRQGVETYAREHESWPGSNADLGLPQSIAGGPVIDVQVGAGGAVTVTFAGPPEGLAGQTVVLDPLVDDSGKLVWDCSGGTLPARYRPAECRP